MPRSIKIVIQCDACGREIIDGESSSEGLSPVLTIDGVGPRQLDFCETCFLSVSVQNMTALFNSATDIPTQQPSTRSGRESCGLCSATSPTPQGLGRHTKSAHGMTVAEMREAARG